MPKTAAFNAEAMRAKMLEGVALPKGMVQDALDTVYRKLKAKETKFFSHQGVVVSKADVEAHEVQLQAAKTIINITDLAIRKEDRAGSGIAGIALRIDSKTGVMTMLIGASADDLDTDAVMEREPLALEAKTEVIELNTFQDDIDNGVEVIKSKNAFLKSTLDELREKRADGVGSNHAERHNANGMGPSEL